MSASDQHISQSQFSSGNQPHYALVSNMTEYIGIFFPLNIYLSFLVLQNSCCILFSLL